MMFKMRMKLPKNASKRMDIVMKKNTKMKTYLVHSMDPLINIVPGRSPSNVVFKLITRVV